MLNEALTKNTLVPLLLRLGLAAVFIYHGWTKIGPDSEWGAAWANKIWNQQSKVPPRVKAALEKERPNESEESKARKKELEEELSALYNKAAGEFPPALSLAGAQFAVAWGELLGGIAMLLGFLTRWAALGLIIIQLGAIVTVTGGKGFAADGGVGYEYNLILVVMCLVLVLTGGGTLSLDHLVSAKRRKAPQKPETTPAVV